MLKKAIDDVYYKQGSALDEHFDDPDGYFHICPPSMDIEEEKNYFLVVFKNKTVFHFWFKKGIINKHCISFSLDHYRFLLENPGFSSRYDTKDHGMISEMYALSATDES
jgi:hypothetical protein